MQGDPELTWGRTGGELIWPWIYAECRVHAHVSLIGLRNVRESSRCYSLRRLTLVVLRPALEALAVGAAWIE